jgi:hypothetical protein
MDYNYFPPIVAFSCVTDKFSLCLHLCTNIFNTYNSYQINEYAPFAERKILVIYIPVNSLRKILVIYIHPCEFPTLFQIICDVFQIFRYIVEIRNSFEYMPETLYPYTF